jgi:hypothetical protein
MLAANGGAIHADLEVAASLGYADSLASGLVDAALPALFPLAAANTLDSGYRRPSCE